MKNQTTKKLIAFIIMVMFSFTFASAQTCNGNKISVYKCMNGNCHSKCVSPAKIPAGWNTVGCGTGCGGGGGCNCNVRPIPFGCGQICGWRIGSYENDNPSVSFIASIAPNPVFNTTIISFSLSQSENVTLKIFDMNGRLVSILADKFFEGGENELAWNTDEVNAGIYFLQFQSAENFQMEKLIVAK